MSEARDWRAAVPWWLKLGTKVVLNRMPVPYDMWRRVGAFKHGQMLDGAYAKSVFARHRALAGDRLPAAFTLLELGPGDSLATAFLAQEAGSAHTWLVDVGPFAKQDVAAYAALLDQVPASSRGDMAVALEQARATYLTEGLTSLRSIPAGTVDFTFSHAVLEHVPILEFDETMRELFRIQKAGGVGTHVVDLRDHLEGGLNALRFSRRQWESPLLRDSGFYTNRLRSPEIRASFERVGYRILQVREQYWPRLPTPRRAIHREFQHFSDAELMVHDLELVVEKPGS